MKNNNQEGTDALLQCPVCARYFLPVTHPLPLLCNDCLEACDKPLVFVPVTPIKGNSALS